MCLNFEKGKLIVVDRKVFISGIYAGQKEL